MSTKIGIEMAQKVPPNCSGKIGLEMVQKIPLGVNKKEPNHPVYSAHPSQFADDNDDNHKDDDDDDILMMLMIMKMMLMMITFEFLAARLQMH